MPREGTGQLPALLLEKDSLPAGHQETGEGEQALRLAKQPRMQGLVLLLLAGVMLCCLGIFLSLPAPTSEVPGVPSALAGTNVGHMDRAANAPAPLPNGSYPLTLAEELQETDKLPVNSYLMTTLVLALAYFGASVRWLLMTNARRQRVMCCSLVNPSLGSSGSKRFAAPSLRSGASMRKPLLRY
jgi:hypothetical protein